MLDKDIFDFVTQNFTEDDIFGNPEDGINPNGSLSVDLADFAALKKAMEEMSDDDPDKVVMPRIINHWHRVVMCDRLSELGYLSEVDAEVSEEYRRHERYPGLIDEIRDQLKQAMESSGM